MLVPFGLSGAEFFVSTNGTGQGIGTVDHPWSLSQALASPAAVSPDDKIWLRGGVYLGQFTSQLKGAKDHYVTLRQYPGERAIIDGSLEIRGEWTLYWGFEVRNSDPVRINTQWTRPPGVYVYGPGTKLINLLIHDAGQGIGWWEEAENSEVYGCLIWNNGNSKFDHGVYAQNRVGIKFLTENIIFNNYGYGLHVFGSEKAALENFIIRGNTIFNNGSISAEQEAQNILIGGYLPVKRVLLYDNMTFSAFKPSSVSLGSDFDDVNEDLEMRHNYFADFVSLRTWRIASVSGNTLFAPGEVVTLKTNRNVGNPRMTVDNNNYFSGESDGKPFGLGTAEKMKRKAFADWKQDTGFDAHSSYTLGSPSGFKVFARRNRYEPERVQITVFNWGRMDKVPVDLGSFLKIGDEYEVRNAQDFFAPLVAQGRFNGQAILLPMTGLTVASPVGLKTPAPTGPLFNVFILFSIPPSRTR